MRRLSANRVIGPLPSDQRTGPADQGVRPPYYIWADRTTPAPVSAATDRTTIVEPNPRHQRAAERMRRSVGGQHRASVGDSTRDTLPALLRAFELERRRWIGTAQTPF
jgi:hypothetical protein